ncbi:MAG: acetyl-CoA carboxylase carboxyltransferase subunit alpha [Puniceicoccales bacterium]|jgi:acetyl-CoA carboxylase carboxyl transferase subunit alpha|nr:acetyl-CoA carboxylase carboxyltransferase subunit alpha [Puniceicoccales bacterium]
MAQTFVLDFEKPIKTLSNQLEVLNERASISDVDFSEEIASLKGKIEQAKKKIYSNLTEWQRVQLARHPMRPYSLDYIGKIFTNFQELHGDRLYADDQSMVCGIGELDTKPIMIIAQQKGRNTKESIVRNFGMQHPEGYRKALRLMKLAARFSMPIVTFVDTPGAFPGIESEERHVAEAIAVNLREMMLIKSPIISVFIGEGGSGGALGIAVADRILILENAYYSVISPEGCAAILWNDRAAAPEAAKALRLSSQKLIELGVVDEIIREPLGGAHNDHDFTADAIKCAVARHLKNLSNVNGETLLKLRYERFRKFGIFETKKEAEPENFKFLGKT